MPARAVAFLAVIALVAGACGTKSGATTPSSAPGSNPCGKANLPLVSPGSLTIGTDNPAYDPYFLGPAGHAWKGKYNHDPYSGQGFEDAVAYAVARQLGFAKGQVQWVAVPFNNSYKPGPKNFDFYLAQVSYQPVRAQSADLSSSYYDVQQAVVSLAGKPIDNVTTVAGLKPFTLGTQVGTSSYDLIKTEIQPDNAPQVYNTLDAALQALKNGQIDGLVTDYPTVYYMANIQLSNGAIVGILPTQGPHEHFSLVLQKGSGLTSCVNGAIAKLRTSGELAQIQNRWLNQAAHARTLQ
jgi:polar amino acid transport system substrate-binding protein